MSPESKDLVLPGVAVRIDALTEARERSREDVARIRKLLEIRERRFGLLSQLLAIATRLADSQYVVPDMPVPADRVLDEPTPTLPADPCPYSREYSGGGECCDCPVSCCYCGKESAMDNPCDCATRTVHAGDRVNFEYCKVQRTVKLDIQNDEFIAGLEEARGGVTHEGSGLYKQFNWTGISSLEIVCEC